MSSTLYTDIIEALSGAERLGATRVTLEGECLSQREALRRFGAWAVREYERIYGAPTRTGGCGNSKKVYLAANLVTIVEGRKIESLVVSFEQKVREHQRKLTKK